MKTTSTFLSLICCLTLPLVVHADPAAAKSKKSDKAPKHVAAAARTVPTQAPVPRYIITRNTFVGSHIPTVIYKDGPRLISASSATVYNASDLNQTGFLDVGSELNFIDPAFTGGGGLPHR